MPDVGTLNITIKSDAEQAAQGLKELAGALSDVQKAAPNGLNLAGISGPLNKFAKAVKDNSKPLANIGTFLNAITNYTNAFKKLDGVKFNRKPIDDIKAAVGDGIKIGQAGTQINKLREALGGEWNTDNAEKASTALATIAKGAEEMKGKNLGKVAEGVSAVAKALEEYAVSATHIHQAIGNKQFGLSQEQRDQLEESARKQREWVEEGGFASGTPMPLNLTFFGGRRAKQVPGQVGMDLDGTMAKIQEVVNQISVTDAVVERITSHVSTATDKFSSFFESEKMISPLAMMTAQFRESEKTSLGYANAIGTILPKVNQHNSELMIEAGNARIAAMSEQSLATAIAEAQGLLQRSRPAELLIQTEQIQSAEQFNIVLNETGDIVTSVLIPRFQEMYETWSMMAYEFGAFQMQAARLVGGDSPLLLGDGRTPGQLMLGDGTEAETFLSTWVQAGETFKTNWVDFTSDVAAQWRAMWSPDWILGGWQTPVSMSSFHLGQGDSPLLLGDGGVSPDEMLSTWIDTSEQWKQNWIVGEGYVSDAAEEAEQIAAKTQDAANEANTYNQNFQSAKDSIKGYYASLEDMFNGIRHGKVVENDLLPKWLHGEGTQNEQLYALKVAAQMFGMTLDEVREKIAGLIADEQAAEQVSGQLTGSTSVLAGAIDSLKQGYNTLKTDIAEAGGALNYFKNGIEKMFPTLTGLLKRFKSMMIMRSLRYVIRELGKGLREGVQNVYQYSKAVGTSFAPAMDQAATALQQMKNSIGAAVAPVIQALIPVLQTVVNWVISGINYLNQFFALLNGQATWTRALPEAAEAFEKNTKAAKGSSKAMKDLLADWDELNIIQSNSGSGGGSGTGKTAEEYKNMFEEVSEFNSTIKNIVDGIEDTFGDIWGLVKRIGAIILGWKLSNAFTGILGTLGGLVGSVVDIGLVFELSTMFTNNFLKTGNAGWLVGDVLTTLVGSVIARKILSKVLGGVLAKVAIPLTFAVSAAATIKALVQKTDVTALSEKGILSAMNAALEGGVAGGALLYSTGAYTLATSAGVGAGAALFTFGATVGIKATADVVNTKEITSDTIAADFLAAGSIGAGLALSEAVLGGTIATIATVGLGGALLAFGAFIAVQAIIANDKIHVQWGDYDATEKEIKAFVEEKVFATSPDAILQLIDPVVEVATTSNKELETTVGKVNLSVKKLTIGYDVDDTLKDLEKQVFGDSENGTTGLIGQFKETAKAHKSVIETGMTLVPTTNDDGSVKEILDRQGEAWQTLTGHMEDLGKELWGHLQTAYSGSVDEGTKKMELRTIAELTQMMANVSAAITQGEQYEEAMLGLEANLNNLTRGSWSNMFDYIEQYKEQVKEAYKQAYDATTVSIAGQTRGFEASWKNELKLAEDAKTESEKEAHLAKAKAYEDEYNYWSEILKQRRAGRDDAIEEAAQGAMNQDTVDRIREVLSGIVAKDLIDKSDVRSLDIAEDMWTALFNQNGEQSEYAERELTGWLEEMIDAAFGEDADAIKDAISIGFLGYGDVIDQAVLDELADAIGINGTSDSIQGAWKTLIDKVFGNEEPKTPGLDNTKLNSSVSSAKEAIAGLVSYVQNEMSRLSETGFDVWASFHGKVDTIPVEQRATGGFVKSGDLVLANENGNFEMMGKMGNQPVVANNQQIVSGISQGVSQANTDVVSELRTVANLMQKMLQKEFVARAVPGSDWGGHNARSNMAYEKVTG